MFKFFKELTYLFLVAFFLLFSSWIIIFFFANFYEIMEFINCNKL